MTKFSNWLLIWTLMETHVIFHAFHAIQSMIKKEMLLVCQTAITLLKANRTVKFARSMLMLVVSNLKLLLMMAKAVDSITKAALLSK